MVYATTIRLDEEHELILDTLSKHRRDSRNKVVAVALEKLAEAELTQAGIRPPVLVDPTMRGSVDPLHRRAFDFILDRDAELLEKLGDA